MATSPMQLLTLFVVMLALGMLTQNVVAARMLAYYPSWYPNYRAANIPYEKLTHICHAFILPNADGTLDVPADFLESALLTKAHNNGVKVLVSVGGATGSGNFAAIAATSTLRFKFVNQVYAFIKNHKYDGVDLDWEFPQDATQRTNMNKLITAFRNKFNNSPAPAPTWQISMAVPASNWFGQWLDYDTLKSQVSFFNVMTYDYHGSWYTHSGHNSPLFQGNDIAADYSFSDTLSYMINQRGVSAAKLNGGVPFYGYKFYNSENVYDNCNGDCSTVYMPYNEIIPLKNNGWTYHWDSASSVPYLRYNSGSGFISYDNPESIAAKVDYALDRMNLGGVFVWDISQDKMPNGNQPLLTAMYNAQKN
jgi:chitinase